MRSHAYVLTSLTGVRQAEKFGQVANKFINEVDKNMGIKVVLYATWVGPDDTILASQYDFAIQYSSKTT
jgi:adenylosuccinate synthase